MPSMPFPPEPGPAPGAEPSPELQAASPPAAAVAPSEPPAPERPPAQPDVLPAPRATGEFNVLCYTLLSLFLVSFGVWVIFAWTDYGKRYPPAGEGWYAGGTRSIEITLVREDMENLDCASDVVLEGLRCGYRADQQPFEMGGTPEAIRLRPYNTVDNVPFLGAGLWSSPGLPSVLPSERFTVMCNYRMVTALKSVATRWAKSGTFAPARNALPAGQLSDCVIPR